MGLLRSVWSAEDWSGLLRSAGLCLGLLRSAEVWSSLLRSAEVCRGQLGSG